MLWNAHNGTIRLDGASMSYASFGHGEKAFAMLPGLSDGLATVKGKALLLAKPYEAFFKVPLGRIASDPSLAGAWAEEAAIDAKLK